MRADAVSVAPAPPASSSFKTVISHLRLNLQNVNGFSEDKEGEEFAGGRSGHSRTVHSVSLACPVTTPRETNGETPDLPQSSGRHRIRSQSAKRPLQNGSHRSESPPSISKISGSPPAHRSVPPKSAPNLRPKGANRGRTVRPRDQNGGAPGKSPERPAGSPGPERIPATQPASGRRVSCRQPRRRLTSRSEELSSSSGDPQSPRLSVSDHHHHQQQQLLQISFNGTLSSDGSEDLRPPPGSSVGRGASGSGSGSTSASSAWDVFEEHVRTIHDSSDLISRYQGPSFRASSTFQDAMTELFGYPDYSHPPGPSVHTVAARGMVVAGAATRFLKMRKKSTLTGGEAAAAVGKDRDRAPPDRQTVVNAKRGWRVLKEYVQENYTSKRTSQAALSWTMLRHTLKGLSDREKTRLDLYRRYGIVPTLDSEGRRVTVNTMLSERARQALASGSRHPHLAHSTTTRATPHHPHTTTSLPAALSSNSLLSPRSSGDSSAGGSHHLQQRGAPSSVVGRSARAAETARASVPGSHAGVSSSSKNGTLRTSSAAIRNRSPNRSHTP